MLILLFILFLFSIWLGHGISAVYQQDKFLLHFNDTDWHIDQLAKPIYIIRFFNAVGFGCGPSTAFASIFLFVIDKLLLKPALLKSLETMKKAEESNTIPDILCNKQARIDFEERIRISQTDIYKSKTMNNVSKVLNMAGAYNCLVNHCALLQLAMDLNVSQTEMIKEPAFIVSLPRTGTTILHRTMALDKTRFRNFDLCDMMAPLPKPVPRWDAKARTQLAIKVTAMFDDFKTLFPGWAECMETMHGYRPGEAEEDQGWYYIGLGHMFTDTLLKLATENRATPIGMSVLETKEVARYRYAWLALIMKLYQHIDKSEWEQRKQHDGLAEDTSLVSSTDYDNPCPTTHLPWLMKDPNHSAYLNELLEEFPDAKLIFSHRSPGDVVPSMAKLFVCVTSVDLIPNAPGTTSKEWGQETLLRMNHYCDGMVDFTKNQDPSSALGLNMMGTKVKKRKNTKGAARRVDFYFKNVVKDIPGTISQIYSEFYPQNPTPSQEALAAFQSYLEENEREKRGNQRRSLEDFHLNESDVAFEAYHNVFLGTIP